MRKTLLTALAALAFLTVPAAGAADVTTAAEASAARAAATANVQATQAAANSAAQTATVAQGAAMFGGSSDEAEEATAASDSASAAAKAASDADPSNMAGKNFTIFTSEVSLLGNQGGPAATAHAGIGNINALAKQAVRILMIGLSILCTVMIVAGGIVMATAGGNQDRIGKGKNMLIYSLVGLSVALSSYLLISLTGWLLEAK